MKMNPSSLFVVLLSLNCLVPTFSHAQDDCTSSEHIQAYKKQIPSNTPVSILWIIDNSNSMHSMQEALSRSVDEIMSTLVTSSINFNMGIVSTDAKIQITGTKKIPTFNKLEFLLHGESFLKDFKSSVMMGTSGSTYEKILDSSVSFLESKATSFLKPASRLILISVSDNDHATSTSTPGMGDVSTLLPKAFLKRLQTWLPSNQVKYIGVFPKAYFAPQLTDLSQLTGGNILSPETDTEFGNSFASDLITSILEERFQKLSLHTSKSVVSDRPIKVFVNESPSSEVKEINFDSSTQLLTFQLPIETDSYIRVEYPVECPPAPKVIQPTIPQIEPPSPPVVLPTPTPTPTPKAPEPPKPAIKRTSYFVSACTSTGESNLVTGIIKDAHGHSAPFQAGVLYNNSNLPRNFVIEEMQVEYVKDGKKVKLKPQAIVSQGRQVDGFGILPLNKSGDLSLKDQSGWRAITGVVGDTTYSYPNTSINSYDIPDWKKLDAHSKWYSFGYGTLGNNADVVKSFALQNCFCAPVRSEAKLSIRSIADDEAAFSITNGFKRWSKSVPLILDRDPKEPWVLNYNQNILVEAGQSCLNVNVKDTAEYFIGITLKAQLKSTFGVIPTQIK